MRKISLFVPGRLCLFGEHSDWAGKYRAMNAQITPGYALVTGVEQGIYAEVEKCSDFVVTSDDPNRSEDWEDFSSKMNLEQLKHVAQSNGFFRYCAGVASYMYEWYNVGGIKITLKKMDLPIKSGLSSSAAICVLVCRAFNELYNLNLSTLGEMNIAYWGELRTASRCGRLDQACAFGVRPVLMNFDAEEVNVTNFNIKEPLYWVFSDLGASKDTVKILADLNKAYPFAGTDKERDIQEALGKTNKEIVYRAIEYMRNGDSVALGKLMCEAQEIFDTKIAPMCPEQLTAPVLHQYLNDPYIKSITLGGKGVGSQGDGSIQFLTDSEENQQKLVSYLTEKGLNASSLTIQPKRTIRKAIIPVAGFGTRLYPMTRVTKKAFFPILDKDGLVKPVILILLEELIESGIEEVCLVLGNEEEREDYKDFFERQLSEQHLSKLNKECQQYENHILEIGKKLRYVYQYEMHGFGDAVYKCVDFAANEPVLLLLGDTIYKSFESRRCTAQFLEYFEKYGKPMIAIHETPLEKVSHYGIISGEWVKPRKSENDVITTQGERVLQISNLTEKPTVAYAEEFLGVKCKDNKKHYYSVFGQYILTPEVFEQLRENIYNAQNNIESKKEIELTTALEQVRQKTGMMGIVLNGKMYDMGIPQELYRTNMEFCLTNE